MISDKTIEEYSTRYSQVKKELNENIPIGEYQVSTAELRRQMEHAKTVTRKTKTHKGIEEERKRIEERLLQNSEIDAVANEEWRPVKVNYMDERVRQRTEKYHF